MAKETVTAPKYREFREIPVIVEGAMADSKPYVAKPAHQEGVGFPGELVDNWQDVAVKKLGELVSQSRALQVFLDTCVKCGACTDKCHYFIGTQDPNNMPVARQDLLRKVYRRHFTFAGKYFPKLVGALDFTEEVRDQWYSYFHQCSQCRRCSVFCPYGIDTAEISMAGREVLDSIGVGQKYCNEILGKVHKIGNNLGLPEPALADTLEGLEEDLEDDTGHKIRVPLDEKGADVLLITPSADFFAEPHIDGLMGYAKVFHQAGISWTVSSYASEAANFSMFIGSHENLKRTAMRIREAALELGVKRIVVGECGHAWRVAYSFWNTLIGPFDFLDKNYPSPSHICEVTYDLLQKGAIKLDKEANDHRIITFHDSCNVSRASRMGNMPGGQFVIPRALLKAAENNFYDMAPETIHENTFCCGGGGGLLTDEIMELRVKGALPRMEALAEVVEKYDVNTLVAICAICKTQFAKVLPYYKFPMDMITSLHQVVGDAIVLGGND
jgi:Fe-S oxidoreductase